MKHFKNLWAIDPDIIMLNHGSFGGVPRVVEQWRYELFRQADANAMRFFLRTLPPLLDASREVLARLAGTAAENLVFVRNATSGVNAVLRSLKFQPGDEILCTDHGYNACRATVEFLAAHDGVVPVVAEIPLPVDSPRAVTEKILQRVTPRTKIALLDHITSATALIFPIREIVRELESRGVPTLVDAAHTPGMLPMQLDAWQPAYFTGNCHKWLCAPRGAAFLYVRPDLRDTVHATTISHGYNNPHPAALKFHAEFDWTGTDDLTPWAAVGPTIEYLAELGREIPDEDISDPDGFFPLTPDAEPDELRRNINRVMVRNRQFGLWAGKTIAAAVNSPFSIAPDTMFGAMYPIVLPEIAAERLMPEAGSDIFPQNVHPLQLWLAREAKIETTAYFWQNASAELPVIPILRTAPHLYHAPDDIHRLAEVLRGVVG